MQDNKNSHCALTSFIKPTWCNLEEDETCFSDPDNESLCVKCDSYVLKPPTLCSLGRQCWRLNGNCSESKPLTSCMWYEIPPVQERPAHCTLEANTECAAYEVNQICVDHCSYNAIPIDTTTIFLITDAMKTDLVNKPPHYVAASGLEVSTIIDDFDLGMWRGNAAKYLIRAPHKGQFVQDCKKGIRSLEIAINEFEKNSTVENQRPYPGGNIMKEPGTIKSIFIIRPVQAATAEQNLRIVEHGDALRREGHLVHDPLFNTDQSKPVLEILEQNRKAIIDADEVHIYLAENTKGSYLDLGTVIEHGKPLVWINPENYDLITDGTIEDLVKQLTDLTAKSKEKPNETASN